MPSPPSGRYGGLRAGSAFLGLRARWARIQMEADRSPSVTLLQESPHASPPPPRVRAEPLPCRSRSGAVRPSQRLLELPRRSEQCLALRLYERRRLLPAIV